jgi:hypothetical protein
VTVIALVIVVFLAAMPILEEMEDVCGDLFHEVIVSFKLSA